jgi:hypothetical protein
MMAHPACGGWLAAGGKKVYYSVSGDVNFHAVAGYLFWHDG